jgi:glycosyl-4,4'-diaponeurosporenoate acyltransferase
VLVELSPVWLVAANVAAWLAVQLCLAWGLTRVPARRFDPWCALARPRRWECGGRVYLRVFRVRRWKDRLPDGATWVGGTGKRSLPARSREALESFARESWRGELVHWLALLALPLFALWNPPWAMLANAAYAATANLPCIIAQRYNRARLRETVLRGTRQRRAASTN